MGGGLLQLIRTPSVMKALKAATASFVVLGLVKSKPEITALVRCCRSQLVASELPFWAKQLCTHCRVPSVAPKLNVRWLLSLPAVSPLVSTNTAATGVPKPLMVMSCVPLDVAQATCVVRIRASAMPDEELLLLLEDVLLLLRLEVLDDDRLLVDVLLLLDIELEVLDDTDDVLLDDRLLVLVDVLDDIDDVLLLDKLLSDVVLLEESDDVEVDVLLLVEEDDELSSCVEAPMKRWNMHGPLLLRSGDRQHEVVPFFWACLVDADHRNDVGVHFRGGNRQLDQHGCSRVHGWRGAQVDEASAVFIHLEVPGRDGGAGLEAASRHGIFQGDTDNEIFALDRRVIRCAQLTNPPATCLV